MKIYTVTHFALGISHLAATPCQRILTEFLGPQNGAPRTSVSGKIETDIYFETSL